MDPHSIYKLKTILNRLLFISFILECIFFFELKNIYASLIILFGWNLSMRFVFTGSNLKKYPLSTLMLFGFALFYFWTPLPATLIELKPVTFNLLIPFYTFTQQLLLMLSMIFSHFIYRKIITERNPLRIVLKHTVIYKRLSANEIWILSLLGLMGMFYTVFMVNRFQINFTERNFNYYLALAFTSFTTLPILFILPKLGIIRGTNHRGNKAFAYFYFSFVAIISIASNIRTLLFSIIATFLLLVFIYYLFGFFRHSRFLTFKYILIYFILGWLFTGPLNDMAVAMVIARAEKSEISGKEMLEKSIKIYQDKDEIVKFRNAYYLINKNSLSNKSLNWDERYLNNTALERFCNLKIPDICLYQTTKIATPNNKIIENYKRQFIAFFPAIICRNVFGMDDNERIDLTSYSLTDYLYSVAANDSSVLGSAIIGSYPGLGMAIFGYWYLLIVFLIVLILSMMVDSFVYIHKGQIIFTAFSVLHLLFVFYFFNNGNMFSSDIKYIMRGYFEEIITYILFITFVTNIRYILTKK
jgi:hypothetical protein